MTFEIGFDTSGVGKFDTKEYYEITGDFNLNITVGLEDKSDIPDMHIMKRELEERFDEVVYQYLDKYNIDPEEVHLILCDQLFRERCKYE